MEFLADAMQYHDKRCLETFRTGGKFYGALQPSGNGRPVEPQADFDPLLVRMDCFERNQKVRRCGAAYAPSVCARACMWWQVLAKLKEDLHEAELLRLSLEDVEMGRMSGPFRAAEVDLAKAAVASRFNVEQGMRLCQCAANRMLVSLLLVAGTREDGSTKVRPIDHMTESLVNASTAQLEKLSTDTLDLLFEITRALRAGCEVHTTANVVQRAQLCFHFAWQEPLELFKADIDSAFRRLPLLPEHRAAATVAFKVQGEPMLFQHNAMCFGAVSSVCHWDRIGVTGMRVCKH